MGNFQIKSPHCYGRGSRNHDQRMKSAQSELERHQSNLFIVNFEQISHKFWMIEMMVRELFMQILLIKTVQSISAKMYIYFFIH